VFECISERSSFGTVCAHCFVGLGHARHCRYVHTCIYIYMYIHIHIYTFIAGMLAFWEYLFVCGGGGGIVSEGLVTLGTAGILSCGVLQCVTVCYQLCLALQVCTHTHTHSHGSSYRIYHI